MYIEGYEDRVSLKSVLGLRGMKLYDGGVYTVRDGGTKEVISIYRVTVESHTGVDYRCYDPVDLIKHFAVVLCFCLFLFVLQCHDEPRPAGGSNSKGWSTSRWKRRLERELHAVGSWVPDHM